MLKHLAWITFLAMPTLCFGVDTLPDIQVHPSGSDGYVITLTSAAVTNVPAAVAVLVPVAQKLCASKVPQFGHFKFEAKAPLDSSANAAGAKTSFVMDQDIYCADSALKVVQSAPADPNWRPSNADYQSVMDTISKYYAARDKGDIGGSYALLDNGMGLSTKEWKGVSDDFAAKTGSVISHRVVKLTWEKDPQSASGPGIYAAADFVDHYELATDCGYLALHQQPNGSFLVIHEENGFIPTKSDLTSAQLTDIKSKLGCVDDEPAPLAESKGNPIGYPTVAAALQALQSRKDVQFQTETDGWVVAYIPAELTIWTFSPRANPAYPAAVKRVITQQGGGSSIDMSVLCEASKKACDDLVRQFEQLNERVKQSLSKKQSE